MYLTTPDGKYLLVGGKFLSVAASAGDTGGGGSVNPPPSGVTTSITLKEYYTPYPTKTFPTLQIHADSMADLRVANGLNLPWGHLPVVVGYVGDAPNLEARVVRSDGVVMKNWTTLASQTADDTLKLAYGQLQYVPMGGAYTLETRVVGTSVQSIGTQKWGVGWRGMWAGQSNMQSQLDAGAYTDIAWVDGVSSGFAEYDFVFRAQNPQAYNYHYWSKSSGPNYPYSSLGGSTEWGRVNFMRLMARALKNRWGVDVPVEMIEYTSGATGISAFLKGGSVWAQFFTNNASTSPGLLSPAPWQISGDFGFMVWHQGETGADTRSSYAANLSQLQTDLVSVLNQYGRTKATFGMFPALLGSYGSIDAETLRGAVYDWETQQKAAGNLNAKVGWNCIDLEANLNTSDGGLHIPSETLNGKQYKRWGNRRMLQTVLKFMDCAPYAGDGPRIDKANVTRSGLKVTIPVIHSTPGASLTSLTPGAGITGFYANTAQGFGAGTMVTGFTAAINGNAIELTFPAGTDFTNGIWIKHMGSTPLSADSYHPDVSNLVLDTAVLPYAPKTGGGNIFSGLDICQRQGLPLLPTADAFKVT